jgi:recombination protein U
MAWTTRGLRGSTLEELINMTNEVYRSKGLAIIQKVPTPITPVKFDGGSRTISLAYFEKKSTVDYIGAAQGVPICFDAKETARKSLPIQNIHEHQIEFMRDFERQGGVAFLLVHFVLPDEYYFLPYTDLIVYWDGQRRGGRKSIPHAAFKKEYRIQSKSGFYIHYLDILAHYVNKGENTGS